jgi:hypothetical protein
MEKKAPWRMSLMVARSAQCAVPFLFGARHETRRNTPQCVGGYTYEAG